MTAEDPNTFDRFRLLAAFLARRPVDIRQAPAGVAAHTTGRTIFVTAGSSVDQRREVLVQAALLGAGSLDPRMVKALRGRSSRARRYLSLEARRVLADLAESVPLAADIQCGREAITATAEESLAVARGRRPVADPPEWFGVIKPSLLITSSSAASAEPGASELRVHFDPADALEVDEERSGNDKRVNQFENPLFSTRSLMNVVRKQLGGRRAAGYGPAGADTSARALRRARKTSARMSPLSTLRRDTGSGKLDTTFGTQDGFYPEWDVHRDRYRPGWCRVIEHPLVPQADIIGGGSGGVVPDNILRRRLARVGLGPKTLRRRPDGDELDLEALIDQSVDLRSGYSPPELVYRERRLLARDLGVLILLDASGSATDADHDGLTVHDQQRRAAATLALTLEGLGDRVALYAFRSHGRHAIHLASIMAFGQRFGAAEQVLLDRLRPSGYTRLGAGIRGAGEILTTRAGTQNRLLLLLSDGLPFEEGYEGHYAEADTRKALEELRGDGVGCLCLSLGADTDTDVLARVFGSAGYATATTLAELSPRMDELFLSSLREFSAPKSTGR
ncbi:VWA domain-containing protein [Nocardia cyriacigeorgica]|uniref:VWA domain-containing protein n=1 Tax=Nocardia cyriacigeorgica TaxID=135487 RepID=A0A5R8PAD2_9NOCA|nr:VWA domain-containing protein [Nocardia cyriacigeorgica]TLG05303.1 VWA domain-containing protein [Nocardia cyriacigeorgica]